MDVHSPAQRSHNMRRVRDKDSKAELSLRRNLHAAGLRYRLHQPNLPGKPDLVLPRFKAVIFMHGCFWHGHDCGRAGLPLTRTEFWARKIQDTRLRDTRVVAQLLEDGWRVFTVWECALRGRTQIPILDVIQKVSEFLHSDKQENEISGTTIHDLRS